MSNTSSKKAEPPSTIPVLPFVNDGIFMDLFMRIHRQQLEVENKAHGMVRAEASASEVNTLPLPASPVSRHVRSSKSVTEARGTARKVPLDLRQP